MKFKKRLIITILFLFLPLISFASTSGENSQMIEDYKTAEDHLVKRDYYQAFKFFKKSAEQGYANAQYALGALHFAGKGTEKNKQESIKWFQKAAEQGLRDAQFELGWCYYNGVGVTKNINQAFKWYQEAAKQEHARAQYELAGIYIYGEDISKDIEKAKYWLKKSCDNGHQNGCKVYRILFEKKLRKSRIDFLT